MTEEITEFEITRYAYNEALNRCCQLGAVAEHARLAGSGYEAACRRHDVAWEEVKALHLECIAFASRD